MTSDGGELELGLQPRKVPLIDAINGVGGYHARVIAACDPCGQVLEGGWNCIGTLVCPICGQNLVVTGFGIYPNDTPAPEGSPA